jgi:hypothetical protein
MQEIPDFRKEGEVKGIENDLDNNESRDVDERN